MKVNDLLPEVYYKESRDFAYIGRLVEVILNYMKTAADCVNLNVDNENIDSNIVDLIVDTLGFELKHSYANKDLIGVASAFSTLLKYKGSTAAIELAIRLLLNSQGIVSESDFEFCILDEEKAEIQINIPDVLSDIILLEDLFDYILPVGVTYVFTRFSGGANKKRTPIKAIPTIDNSLVQGEPASVYAFDDDIGVVKSDAGMNHIGGFYTGVVVTEITDE